MNHAACGPSGSLRVALLTPPGRAALAVVGVHGAGCLAAVDRRFRSRLGRPLADRPVGSIAVGTWWSADDSPGEELVVIRRGDGLEVHSHGGLAAAEAVIASLVDGGAIRVAWTDWLAETGGGQVEVEARVALAAAVGPRAARILCRQLAGALDAEIDRIAGLPEPAARAAAVSRLLRAARVGLRLAGPWRVVVAGPVNAGKSSLVNMLAGRARSIVSTDPGTTRDLVATRLVLGGWEVELVDTAGDRDDVAATSATERAGIASGREATSGADLVLRVVPADHPVPPPAAREMVVLSKADLAAGPAAPPPGGVATSAVTGLGGDELVDRIVANLVPEDRDEPALLAGPVPFTDRQVAAIRELAT